MVKEMCREILKKYAIPSGSRLIGQGFIFQEDNESNHRSKLCQGDLDEQQQPSLKQVRHVAGFQLN